MRTLISIIIVVIILFYSNLQAQHFEFQANFQEHVLIIEDARIGGDNLEEGDEIGIFTEDDICAGATVSDGYFALALAAYGEDGDEAGFVQDEIMSFKFWDSSEEEEVDARIVGGDGVLRWEEGGFSFINLLTDLQPEIVIEQDGFLMGPVEINDTIAAELVIVNNGVADLRIENIYVEGESFSVDFEEARNLNSGDSTTVTVIFNPENVGDIENTLIIISDDPQNEEIQIPLEGLAVSQIFQVPDQNYIHVLPEDTLVFIVRVDVQEGDEVSYIWTTGSDDNIDTLGIDTTITIIFDELQRHMFKCEYSIREYTASIEWQIDVVDFYISTFTPDNLELSYRRNQAVDFSMDVIAIEGIDPTYRWLLTLQNINERVISEEAVANYNFGYRGNHRLVGRVMHDEYFEEVVWQISISSPIQWWLPRSREFDTIIDSQIEFRIIPFNAESDSLEFRWMVNGEITEEVEFLFPYTFAENGEHIVMAVVHDGADVDSVIWVVTVDTDVVDGGLDVLLPREVTLYPAAPNPFNSTTSIEYFLPQATEVKISVFDSSGRLVQTLSEGYTMAGKHRVTLYGKNFSA